VNGLEEQFGTEIQFVWLNIDDPNTLPLREQFGIVQRTRYVLVNAAGEQEQVWIGLLDEVAITEELTAFLETANP
jgi:hypothetical protein